MRYKGEIMQPFEQCVRPSMVIRQAKHPHHEFVCLLRRHPKDQRARNSLIEGFIEQREKYHASGDHPCCHYVTPKAGFNKYRFTVVDLRTSDPDANNTPRNAHPLERRPTAVRPQIRAVDDVMGSQYRPMYRFQQGGADRKFAVN